MTFTEAIDRACEEKTLHEALSWICTWESERIIPVAHKFLNGQAERQPSGQGWESCFGYLIKEVMEQYPMKKVIKKLKGE